MVLSGNLPPIKVPASVSDLKYCQVVIYDNSNVEFSFTVKYGTALYTNIVNTVFYVNAGYKRNCLFSKFRKKFLDWTIWEIRRFFSITDH